MNSCSVIQRLKTLTRILKGRLPRHAIRLRVRNLEWHDLRATFCTRLALAGYKAFTTKALLGHRDMKTTERYIRAHRLTRQVALLEKIVHKLATHEKRPPVLAAVSS